ncbi:MAG: T9SS type A sorting domain-containing protein [Chitinophagales bacterium]|nr:T9SS type A sorting domain-containing protein [Chitinophagales bacterium]
MKNINILLLLLLAGFTSAFAQTQVELHITHKLSGGTFAFNNSTKNNLGNDFNVTRIEYYISKIQIKHDGGMTTDVANHYILANGSQDVTDALGSFNITNVEEISFYIGVDTPINHADPSLQSGPLAPKSPSMHWGWASGYRFVAMEGKSGSGMNQTYEIHALGDQNYMKTSITTTGVMKGGKIIIALNADYTNALKGIDVSAGLIAHGDGADEVKLLNNFNTGVFSPGFPVSVNNVAAVGEEVSIYPNPSYNHNVSFAFNNLQSTADVLITDIQGRTVQQLHVAAGTDVVNVQLQNSGLYFVKVLSADGSTINRKVHIL